MNVIKFQDVILEHDSVFNEIYKNKYAYLVNWQYVVPLEVGQMVYVELSQGTTPIEEIENVLPYDDYRMYIDAKETESINSVAHYLSENQFVADSDITIEEIKKFRTHVATLLYEFYVANPTDNEQLVRMLKYYKDNYIDEVVEGLYIIIGNNFERNRVSLEPMNKVYTCSCIQQGTLPQLSVQTCDTLGEYKLAMRDLMIKYYGSTDFWLDKDYIIKEIIRYLENILRVDLPLTNQVVETPCSNLSFSMQSYYENQLRDLITTFEYILTGDFTGHKNFVSNTLSKWVNELYDNMQW